MFADADAIIGNGSNFHGEFIEWMRKRLWFNLFKDVPDNLFEDDSALYSKVFNTIKDKFSEKDIAKYKFDNEQSYFRYAKTTWFKQITMQVNEPKTGFDFELTFRFQQCKDKIEGRIVYDDYKSTISETYIIDATNGEKVIDYLIGRLDEVCNGDFSIKRL